MLNDMNIFLIGMLGGGLASIAVFSVVYTHFYVAFKDYFYNKDHFLMKQNMRHAMADIEVLKEQIKHIHLDHYDNIVEDEYR